MIAKVQGVYLVICQVGGKKCHGALDTGSRTWAAAKAAAAKAGWQEGVCPGCRTRGSARSHVTK